MSIIEPGTVGSRIHADTSVASAARVRIRSLEVELGGKTVLSDVNLTLFPGQFMGLVGPNGAGKTTLLRSILALVRPSKGRVDVEGAARAIGYVPQRHDYAWDFPISVEETVMTGRVPQIGWLRRPGGTDYRAVLESLERVGMNDLRKRPIGQLSGGQRQRVLVARALSTNPNTLLLDEPFTGLDMPTQEQLTTLFAELSAEGKAVLMSTHDLVSATTSCTHLALVNRTVLGSGAAHQLQDSALWIKAFSLAPDSTLLRAILVSLQANNRSNH